MRNSNVPIRFCQGNVNFQNARNHIRPNRFHSLFNNSNADHRDYLHFKEQFPIIGTIHDAFMDEQCR